jgi:hypothetical protein
MDPAAAPAEQDRALEDRVRRAALEAYLEGQEERALDLLAVARTLAPVQPLPPMMDSGRTGSSQTHPKPPTT